MAISDAMMASHQTGSYAEEKHEKNETHDLRKRI